MYIHSIPDTDLYLPVNTADLKTILLHIMLCSWDLKTLIFILYLKLLSSKGDATFQEHTSKSYSGKPDLSTFFVCLFVVVFLFVFGFFGFCFFVLFLFSAN